MAAGNHPARLYIGPALSHVMLGDSESEGVIGLIDRWRHGARARVGGVVAIMAGALRGPLPGPEIWER